MISECFSLLFFIVKFFRSLSLSLSLSFLQCIEHQALDSSFKRLAFFSDKRRISAVFQYFYGGVVVCVLRSGGTILIVGDHGGNGYDKETAISMHSALEANGENKDMEIMEVRP